MKAAILLGLGMILLGVLIALELHRQQTMTAALPPIHAIARADVDALLRNNRNACLVLGTGSMAPAIRAGGEREVVAVVIYDNRDFATLGKGQLVLFDRIGQLIVHQLAQLDGSGWITSGSANDGYDSGRVTRYNFHGAVTEIYNIIP